MLLLGARLNDLLFSVHLDLECKSGSLHDVLLVSLKKELAVARVIYATDGVAVLSAIAFNPV